MYRILGDFIDTVAGSNLETFHSKCIEWLFKNNPEEEFFKYLLNIEDDLVHLGTISEFNHHDIITVLKIDGEIHLIFWENKIKADFSKKSIVDLIKIANRNESAGRQALDTSIEQLCQYNNFWNRGVSQPYWYQLRWLLLGEKEKVAFLNGLFSKIKMNLNSIESLEIKIHWKILSIFGESELRDFHNSEWEGLKDYWCIGENRNGVPRGDKKLVELIAHNLNKNISPWSFITYFDLIKNISFTKNNDIVKAYLMYLGRMHESVDINHKIANLNRLRLLKEAIQQTEEFSENSFEFEWSAGGSEKSGSALLNICFNPSVFLRIFPSFEKPIIHHHWSSIKFISQTKGNDVTIRDCWDVSKSKLDYIKWTIQIQGNAVKLQFAHAMYDFVNLATTPSDYLKEVLEALFSMKFENNKDLKRVAENLIAEVVNGEGNRFNVSTNLPSSKTGLSFTILEGSNRLAPTSHENIIEILKNIILYFENKIIKNIG